MAGGRVIARQMATCAASILNNATLAADLRPDEAALLRWLVEDEAKIARTPGEVNRAHDRLARVLADRSRS